eukprot:TRINITY_DN1288_c0_g1_i3.p1 TRINITY_DN1288_c0_g1~~TRINITY_DN1288_c0_g1_i3.p1  ORF type:complete len:402 (-),score=87.33 TRINITY_DN1288_c0_g1_i3:40-1245(-)
MHKEVAPLVVPFWEKAEFPYALLEKFRKLGLTGGDIRGYGSAGLSHMQYVLANMEMARVDPSTSTFFTVHCGLAMTSVDLCGNEEQKKRFLEPMARLEKVGCFGLTEPNRGSDASNLETTARKVPGGWLLNGEKRWIGNGTWADIIIIWAKNLETGQICGYIVEKGAPGFSATKIENKISLRIVQKWDQSRILCLTGVLALIWYSRMSLSLTETNLPLRMILAEVLEEFLRSQEFMCVCCIFMAFLFDVFGVLTAWKPVGAAMGIFDCCLQYAKSRNQFGTPLASFQLVQERLARMLGSIQAMALVAWRVSRLFEAGKLTGGQSSLAKAHNTLRGREVASLGREILGGNGIVQDYHVARLFSDMESFYTYEGTYDINSLVAAREVTEIAAIRASSAVRKSK